VVLIVMHAESLNGAVPDWDVVVVGRSYGGLSAALTLGRARRAALLIGTGGPRNESVQHVHGMLTRDGARPDELIDIATKELEKYATVHSVSAHVDEISAAGGVFHVSFDGRRATASRVILATGSNDNPPPIPGLAENWGRGVYTCPYCDGFENADAPLGVVGQSELVVHLGKLLRTWSSDVTVFSSDLSESSIDELGQVGVVVEPRRIVSIHGDGDRLQSVALADATTILLRAMFVAAYAVPNNSLAMQLGCEVDEHGFVVVDSNCETSQRGIWAVGDVTSMSKNMTMAIVDGIRAGAACSGSLPLFDFESEPRPSHVRSHA
jgi:thioredoxin reductase